MFADGNGRWAQARGLSVADGHRAGAENVRERLRDAAELLIRTAASAGGSEPVRVRLGRARARHRASQPKRENLKRQ